MKAKSAIVTMATIALAVISLHGEELENRFINPPPEAKPWLYWYWMNGNVTREGIRADMHGFADVGIGGALTFDIGIHPAGAVTNRSREWYDLIQFAAAEADKHGLKMGFHCPGWSASGGPWITPELGMQELTWSETVVEGPREFATALPQPRTHLNFYRDAAMLAFPTSGGDAPLPIPATTAVSPTEFDLDFPQPIDARAIFVRAGRSDFNAELSVDSRVIAKFRSHISGPFSAHIGCATFTPVRAGKFRLKFDTRIAIEQLELFRGYRLPDWTSKAGFATDRVEHRSAIPAPLPADAIALNKIVDLTGQKSWSVPAGRWTVLRIGYTPTGVHIAPAPRGGDGLECDKLSREVADFHYDKCVTPLLPLVKQVAAYYHVDSYEAGWQNWTATFPQEFRARRGYDLVKYLPALTGRVVGDLETTEKFLWDFRRTIGDLYADNHYGQLAKRCHADGLEFSTEPYGGPFEFLQAGTRADYPMDEFWLPTRPHGRKIAFPGVMAGRSAGRRILGAESFTSGAPDPVLPERWDSHPYSLKALGDFIYCCGVNRFVIHVSAHQPLVGDQWRPGFTCGCNGIHFDRCNTWWEHGAKEWATYLARCQSLLQFGEHVAEALYFQGNDTPDGVGPVDPQLPDSFDYDLCNAEVLERLGVQDGKVVLPSGKSYRYLVLQRHARITLASLRKIAALAHAGAQLVGSVPKESPSLADAVYREDYERLAQTVHPAPVFPPLAPDFTSDFGLHHIHRRAGDTDLYFVASPNTNAVVANCSFRVTDKVPELWRPDTGTMEPCTVYEQSDAMTKIALRFDPAGSVFVVFRPGEQKVHAVSVERIGATGAPPAKLTIRSAKYGPSRDQKRTIDVTGQLAAQIRNARLKLQNFERLAGDPAPGVVKHIEVEYELDSKINSATARDGEELLVPPPDGKLPPFEWRNNRLRAWENGHYRIVFSDAHAQTVEIDSIPAPQTIAGPWTVEFPTEKTTFSNLVSWSEHNNASVKYFSGTATYRTRFTSHATHAFLDLGRVEVIAEVWLNGKPLGTLWKPPFRCDVTGVLRDGENELEVRVTNLWPNRLIGDEQFPDDLAPGKQWSGIPAWPDWMKSGAPRPEPRRQTFFTWKHWSKGDALLPSGLFGPVAIYAVTEN